MSSGPQQLIYQTRSRALSTNNNLAQQFLSAAVASQAQWINLGSNFIDSGLDTVIPISTGNPPVACILGGLQVNFGIGATYATVDAGAAFICDLDSPADPNDNPVKYVEDPGLTNATTLTFASNGGSGVRIDVIECQRTVVTTSTSSQDIYDPTTGLFTPQLLPLVQAQQFTYRIRRGTAGSGFPGTASGWLPLAVISVPTSATNWDGCVIWDVRPLLADAAAGHFARYQANFPMVTSSNIASSTGYIRGAYGYVKVGGPLPQVAQGGPFTLNNSGAFMDIATGALGEGLSVPGSAPPFYSLYVAMPFGLPRWMLYTQAALGYRAPCGFRGILIASFIPPSTYLGVPNAALPFPTFTGLSGTTTTALCIGTASWIDNGSGGQELNPFAIANNVVYTSTTGGYGLTSAGTTSATNSGTASFTMNDADFVVPATARSIDLQVQFNYTGSAALDGVLTVYLNDTSTTSATNPGFCNIVTEKLAAQVNSSAAVTAQGPFTFTFKLPVSLPYPSVALQTRKVRVNWYFTPESSSGNLSASSISANVIRYDQGCNYLEGV